MALADFFSADYHSARARFVLAADRLGWRRETHDIGIGGPAGESPCIDTALLGNPFPESVVVVSFGLRGIEGFFGSAVQLAFLEQQAVRLSSSVQCGNHPGSRPQSVRFCLATPIE
jgi:hypothetical protein